jgi:hypothetical protein
MATVDELKRRYEDLLTYLTPDCAWQRTEGWRHGYDDLRASFLARPADLLSRHVVTNFIAANDSGYPPGPSRVVIRFLNSAGRPVTNRSGEVIRQVVELQRGESTSFDLSFGEFPPGPSLLV